MKTTSLTGLPLANLRKGFTLIELLVVITVIAILAAIAVPATTAVIRSARNAESTANMSGITKALIAYQVDNGAYPMSATGTTSNDHFRELFAAGLLDGGSEQLFYVNGSSVSSVKPDNSMAAAGTTDGSYDAAEVLKVNECGFAYLEDLAGNAPSGAYIVFDAYEAGSTSDFSRTLRGNTVLAATVSGGVNKARIDAADPAVIAVDGVDILEFSNAGIFGAPANGATAHTLAQPDQ